MLFRSPGFLSRLENSDADPAVRDLVHDANSGGNFYRAVVRGAIFFRCGIAWIGGRCEFGRGRLVGARGRIFAGRAAGSSVSIGESRASRMRKFPKILHLNERERFLMSDVVGLPTIRAVLEHFKIESKA